MLLLTEVEGEDGVGGAVAEVEAGAGEEGQAAEMMMIKIGNMTLMLRMWRIWSKITSQTLSKLRSVALRKQKATILIKKATTMKVKNLKAQLSLKVKVIP